MTLREAAQAVVSAWIDDESGMESFDPEHIERLSEALERKGHAQDEPHEFEAVCRVCGEHGRLNVSFIGPDEGVQIVKLRPDPMRLS
jgi:hypothetical protein